MPYIESSSDDAQFGDSWSEEKKVDPMTPSIASLAGLQPQEEAKDSSQGSAVRK